MIEGPAGLMSTFYLDLGLIHRIDEMTFSYKRFIMKTTISKGPGLQRSRDEILGLGPRSSQNAIFLLRVYYENDDFGCLGLQGSGAEISGLGRRSLQNSIFLLKVYYENDDFGSPGLQKPGEEILDRRPQ